MRSLKFQVASLLALGLFASVAHAEVTCDGRLGELNDRFTAEYVNLEAECYPKSDEPVVAPECGFTLTPECQAKYEALGLEVSSAWDEFFTACPDYYPTTVSDTMPTAAAGNERSLSRKPVTKAPSKKELLNRVSKLQRKVSNLKKSLRNARMARESSERRCRVR
jgi:hypothetical protein